MVNVWIFESPADVRCVRRETRTCLFGLLFAVGMLPLERLLQPSLHPQTSAVFISSGIATVEKQDGGRCPVHVPCRKPLQTHSGPQRRR